MLPFTKRPGREESSDVVAKDDIAAKSSPAVVPPASSSRPTTMRPPASVAPPARIGDFDDEMTGLRPPQSLQSLQNSNFPAPIPAAGRPASIAPRSRPSVRPAAGGPASLTPASMRPPPASARAYEGDDDEDAEDEDGGRTVVRPEGAGKVRRVPTANSQPPPRATPSANPTSISPAAVIRKTMESARQSRGLVSGPPPELRGDLDQENDEFTQTAAPSNRIDRTMNSSRSGRNYPAPASYEGPPSHRPPPRGDLRADETVGSRRNQYDSMDDDSYSQPPRSQHAPMRTYDAGPPPSSSPMSGPRSQPPPSSARPGHFASTPPPHSYAPPANGVNPHAATAAMSAVSTGPYHAMPGASAPPQPMQPQMGTSAMPAHFRMAQTGAIQGVGMVMADPPGTSVTSNTRVSGRPAMSWAAALAACGVFVGVVAVAIAQRGDSTADTQAAFVDPAHTGKTATTQPVETAQQPPSNPLPPGLIGASPVPAAPTVAPVPGMSDPSLGLAPPPAQPPAAAPTTDKDKDKVASAKPKPAAPRTFRPASPPRGGGAAAGDDDDDKPAKPSKPKGGGKGDADEETRRALEELRKAQLEQSIGDKK